ncbi:hypothetical protein TL16_g10895 [Triparma laevis f. inornata]|uniref:Uncharacterized protein n=1 Tax=Triparma laevis f. inornata TaxID=1714386 RepID=A0A9W7ERW3_9STRA|nr:hypothetical protein TL16_g10895 [Triparma laevis f. inornata]
MPSSKVTTYTHEANAVLNTITNVCAKRSATGFTDAGNQKPNASAKKIKVMMDGVEKSIKSKVQKIVQQKVKEVDGGEEVDQEAKERVEKCQGELAAIGERVTSLRKEVVSRLEKVEAAELAARNDVSIEDFEDDSEEASSTTETIGSMKQSMTKLGATLVNLAQTMPDKMEGFAKTIEAVQEGADKTDDVNEEVRVGEAGKSSSDAAQCVVTILTRLASLAAIFTDCQGIRTHQQHQHQLRFERQRRQPGPGRER